MSDAGQGLWPDPLFVDPFVDIDERRADPVAHRYVHGGFASTDLRFSMYFPDPDTYDGRFYQPLMHIAGDENVAPGGLLAGFSGNAIQFATECDISHAMLAVGDGHLIESTEYRNLAADRRTARARDV